MGGCYDKVAGCRVRGVGVEISEENFAADEGFEREGGEHV